MQINRVLIIALPLVIGGLAALLVAQLSGTAIPVAYLRADVATLTLLAGGLGSALSGVVIRVRSRQQAALEQVQAASSEDRYRFLRRLDHELKNPITGIYAGLGNLTDALEQGDDWRGPVRSMEFQVGRLSQLVRDLRQLADLERRQPQTAPVNVADLLRDLVTVVQEESPERAGRVILTLPAVRWTVPPVSAERDLLFLALYNLVDNALKFSTADDQVEVRLSVDDDAVRIEVADTGPGIAPEDLPHVWEELYRGKQRSDVPGSGLGLALVRAIIRQHGGRVSLRSQQGAGTVATVRLPLQPDKGTARP